MAAALAAAVLVTPACGVRERIFGGGSPTRKGTLAVVPPSGPAGTAFTLNAGGLRPGEAMTFEIDIPHKAKYVGPPHTAGPDGKVTATYTAQAGNPAGVYRVKAVGVQGTRAEANVTIVPGGAPAPGG